MIRVTAYIEVAGDSPAAAATEVEAALIEGVKVGTVTEINAERYS